MTVQLKDKPENLHEHYMRTNCSRCLDREQCMRDNGPITEENFPAEVKEGVKVLKCDGFRLPPKEPKKSDKEFFTDLAAEAAK